MIGHVATSEKWKWVRRGAMVAAGVLLSGFLVIAFDLLPMGEGSLADAREWGARLRDVQSVEQAQYLYPKVRVKTFENGDWLVVVSTNSHGNPWGGTVVTRDNLGTVRSFFGHVCGWAGMHSDAESLAEAYEQFELCYSDTPGKAKRPGRPNASESRTTEQ